MFKNIALNPSLLKLNNSRSLITKIKSQELKDVFLQPFWYLTILCTFDEDGQSSLKNHAGEGIDAGKSSISLLYHIQGDFPCFSQLAHLRGERALTSM